MPELMLTSAEIAVITGRRTLRQQVNALVRMGVPFRFGGGQVSVLRAVAEELPQWQQIRQTRAPRLDMVR